MSEGSGRIPSSTEIVDYVRHHPGCTSRDIAVYYGTDLINVSRKTSRLHDQGFIAREPEDLRQAPRNMCYRLWVLA